MVCEADYYRSNSESACERCQDGEKVFFYLGSVAVGLLSWGLLFWALRKQLDCKLKENNRKASSGSNKGVSAFKRVSLLIGAQLYDRRAVLNLKMALAYYQIILALVDVYRVRLPPMFQRFLDTFVV